MFATQNDWMPYDTFWLDLLPCSFASDTLTTAATCSLYEKNNAVNYFQIIFSFCSRYNEEGYLSEFVSEMFGSLQYNSSDKLYSIIWQLSLEKNPSTHPGQVHFPLGQATFPAHLPHRQEPRQATHIHFETKSKFKAHGYNQVSTWSLTKITNNYNHVVLLIAQLEFTVPKWLPSTFMIKIYSDQIPFNDWK